MREVGTLDGHTEGSKGNRVTFNSDKMPAPKRNTPNASEMQMRRLFNRPLSPVPDDMEIGATTSNDPTELVRAMYPASRNEHLES